MRFQIKSTFQKQPQPNILYVFFAAHEPQL